MSGRRPDAPGSGPPAAPPASIVILRTSALGDVVHCLPVASALRRAFPAARLAWVVEEPFLPLVASHPAVDEALPVALRRWRHAPLATSTRREVAAFVRRLRAFGPEVALDLMGNHKGGILARVSGAPRRLGAARRHRREPSSALWLDSVVEPTGTHAVDRALSLLTGLGVTAASAEFPSASLLPAEGDVGDTPDEPVGYLLLQPGAGWGNKRYPVAWWGELARTFAGARHRVRVLAGPGEMPLAAAVSAAAGGELARPIEPGSLTALAAWLRGARLLVGGDTGPLHLAHALGVSVLALHGPTDPARHGPYGAPERALYKRLPCSFCYKRFADTKACLLELSPHLVAARVLALLAAA